MWSTYPTWLAVAHQVARETGARITAPPEPPTPGRNHYRLLLAGPVPLCLLLADDLVAAADPGGGSLTPPFRPVPRPDLFTLAGLRVLDPPYLEQPLTEALIAAHFEAERRDIEYHRPPRLGDVLFNWFD